MAYKTFSAISSGRRSDVCAWRQEPVVAFPTGRRRFRVPPLSVACVLTAHLPVRVLQSAVTTTTPSIYIVRRRKIFGQRNLDYFRFLTKFFRRIRSYVNCGQLLVTLLNSTFSASLPFSPFPLGEGPGVRADRSASRLLPFPCSLTAPRDNLELLKTAQPPALFIRPLRLSSVGCYKMQQNATLKRLFAGFKQPLSKRCRPTGNKKLCPPHLGNLTVLPVSMCVAPAATAHSTTLSSSGSAGTA